MKKQYTMPEVKINGYQISENIGNLNTFDINLDEMNLGSTGTETFSVYEEDF